MDGRSPGRDSRLKTLGIGEAVRAGGRRIRQMSLADLGQQRKEMKEATIAIKRVA